MVRKRSEAKADKPSIDELFSSEQPIDSEAVDPPERIEQAPRIFETASGDGRPQFPPLPELQRGFHEIVRDLLADGFDVVAEYHLIRDSLAIQGALTPRAIEEAANQCESMADRAYRLYCVAVNEYDVYMRNAAIIESALREAATNELERQKAARLRTKQITDADVVAQMAQGFPDEWSELQSRKCQAKSMLDYLSNLSALAKSRCFSVSKMQRGE